MSGYYVGARVVLLFYVVVRVAMVFWLVARVLRWLLCGC